MSLMVQLKFQPVTKYVRPYGAVINYYIVILQTDSLMLQAKRTPRYTLLVYEQLDE